LVAVHPDFAKVLVRDNPAFPSEQRRKQLRTLREVSEALDGLGVPLLYELLVPATDEQRAAAGGTTGAYDRDVRPGLVTQVIADNQEAGVEPAIWKVEGLETAEAARAVVAQIRAGGRDDVRAIVLGRDAPAARLDHWLAVAAPIDGFVGFAIGRSIWEDPIADHNHGTAGEHEAIARIAGRYLDFARQYCAASGATPGPDAGLPR
jgi:myo-inositol catabolism protein IolC